MAAKLDLSSILIERVVIHDIPQHKKDIYSTLPKYSEQESNLSDGLRVFLKDKVVQSLSSDKAFKICFDDSNSSPVSWLSKEILDSDGTNLVINSKKISQHLFEIQGGSNAAGILVIIYGKINSFTITIILKLERDKGVQLTLDEKTQSYNLEEVQDLMLTQKTKIFKVALFISKNDFSLNFDGIIMDYQIDIKAKKEVITWFIEKFLGCKAFEDPKITTKYFFNHTRSYIDTIDDTLTKAKYIQDLNSYIQKNSSTLSPLEFANDYLNSTEHRNDYKNYLNTKNFPFSSFPKDTSQIDKLVKKFVVIFENDITIIGNKGTFAKNVELKNMDNGLVKAEITSKIKSIK